MDKHLLNLINIELNFLEKDIVSSTIIQEIPYINGIASVKDPEKHLLNHVEEIRRLLKYAGEDNEQN